MRHPNRFFNVQTFVERVKQGNLTPGDAELAYKDLEILEENGAVPRDRARELKVKLMGLM